MPLYEYQCDACGHRFEVIQKFSDAPIDTCPKCSGAVQKLLSSPAIQFKGTGWYITDYARGGKSEGTVGSGSNTSGGSTATPKADAPSESKTESKVSAASPTTSD